MSTPKRIRKSKQIDSKDEWTPFQPVLLESEFDELNEADEFVRWRFPTKQTGE